MVFEMNIRRWPGGDLSLECHLRVGFCENEQRRGLWLKGPSGYLIGAAIEESGRA